jgi:hypothetical protein
MTGKEVETVAVLLKRVKERAESAKRMITTSMAGGGSMLSPGYAAELSEGLKSLAAALEMVTIELSDMRRSHDQHIHKDHGLSPLRLTPNAGPCAQCEHVHTVDRQGQGAWRISRCLFCRCEHRVGEVVR